MSILVSVGSNTDDIKNLQIAKDVTSFISDLINDKDNNSILSDKHYTQSEIDKASKWFDDILSILYNGGNLHTGEDVQSITYLEPNITSNFGLEVKPESQLWFKGELYLKYQSE
jgi:hypothetical protein